jgi:hypothetical protein
MATRSSTKSKARTTPAKSDFQYVIGADGKPTAVLLPIASWERIVEALEDAEDLAIVQQALAELEAVGGDTEKAGYISWKQARAELERLSASEK